VLERFEGIRVDARSLGGIATTLSFPEMALTVDMGVCTPAALRTATLALTHTHADHVSGLHQYLGVRRLFGMAAPRIVAPAEALPALTACIDAMGALQGRPFEPEVVGVRPGDEVALGGNRLFLRAFPARHSDRIASVGYLVIRRVTRLREAYLGLSGPEIARRKAEPGADLFEVVDDPLVAVTGDTTAQGLADLDPAARRARVLFVEATFVGDRHDLEAARLGGHVHLDELVPLLRGVEARTIVLYHFSQTYRVSELVDAVANRVPAELAGRVRLLLPEEGDRL